MFNSGLVADGGSDEDSGAVEQRTVRVRAAENAETALLEDGRVVVVRVPHRPAADVSPRLVGGSSEHESHVPVGPHVVVHNSQHPHVWAAHSRR